MKTDCCCLYPVMLTSSEPVGYTKHSAVISLLDFFAFFSFLFWTASTVYLNNMIRTDEEEAHVRDPTNEGTTYENAQNAQRRKSVGFLWWIKNTKLIAQQSWCGASPTVPT